MHSFGAQLPNIDTMNWAGQYLLRKNLFIDPVNLDIVHLKASLY